jgi:predicted  nucleic acid-binding Zn-ribbon protein
LYRQRSLSFSRRPDETPLEDALSDDARNETESNKTGKGFFNKRALSPQPTSSSISSILSKNLRPMSLAADGPQDQRFEQMLLALKQAEKEKQQEADRVKELRDQVAALKLKLDAKYTDDIAKLTQGNELLKMAVKYHVHFILIF